LPRCDVSVQALDEGWKELTMDRNSRFGPSTRDAALTAIAALGLSVAGLGAAPHWSYEGATGPDHWGDLSPDFILAKTGKSQSPIDISRTYKTKLEKLAFAYADMPLRIVNNAHTVEEKAPPKLDHVYPSRGHVVLHDAQDSVTIDGEAYRLAQFHFHSPSEHTVNGRHHDMEVHLVHANQRGEIAVIGVFMDQGRANGLVQILWDSLPKKVNKERVVPGAKVNASALLPADRSYYRYYGSFTTPPCTEGVTWIVMRTPVEVSAAQIRQFKSSMRSANNRPVQPLNKRFVLESE